MITAQHTAHKKTQHIEHTAHMPFTAPSTQHRNININVNNSGLPCANDQCVWDLCAAVGQNALYMFQFDNVLIQYNIYNLISC